MAEKKEKLFTDFKSVLTEEWEAKIHADLQGRDYEKALVWRTYEGFDVHPYYRRDDLKGLEYLKNLPGEFPFIRGNKKNINDWFIRQNIVVNDFEEANRKILNILGKGVNSLGLIFECGKKVTKSDMEILLNNICLESIETNFVCQCCICNHTLPFVEYLANNRYDKNKIIGSFSIDPIGSFILKGKLKEDSFGELKTIAEKTVALPNFRIIGVHGKFFADSGASLVQELAFALAQGADYLTRLTDAGLSIDDAANNIKFIFGIGNNYFMEIAKLRAARLLWAHIVKAFDPKDEHSAKLISHSETNYINKTIYDPYVNMLRTQTEAMSAVLGGADSITVQPFNAVYGETNEFSERIARNQQILLKEESHLDKVVDPGAGSYYIEKLTASIADHAWELFLKVQDKGGFINGFREGYIQSEINALAAKRAVNAALRRDNILGASQFPNFSERMKQEVDTSLFQPADFSEEEAEVETLKLYRHAQPFEALRYKTDIYSLKNKRPVVFILPVGTPAQRRARAQFSCNFFAVGGFDVIDNNGYATADEGVIAAKAKNSDIVVVCSSDEEYVEIAPKVAGLLDNEILVVAGNPACRHQLEEKGISNFIYLKSNVLEELKRYQIQLGI